jgi:hypothetical protein
MLQVQVLRREHPKTTEQLGFRIMRTAQMFMTGRGFGHSKLKSFLPFPLTVADFCQGLELFLGKAWYLCRLFLLIAGTS